MKNSNYGIKQNPRLKDTEAVIYYLKQIKYLWMIIIIIIEILLLIKITIILIMFIINNDLHNIK